MTRSLSLAALAVCAAAEAPALTPELPGPAETMAEVTRPLDSYRLPTGPWSGDGIPTRLIEGEVQLRAWRIEAPGTPTLALMQPLRLQVEAAGYRILFECETQGCGGFDFRFGTEVLPEPDMHVDLGDFRFLSAMRGAEAVSFLVSRSTVAGFVQMTRVGPSSYRPDASVAALPDVAAPEPGQTVTLSAAGAPPMDIAAALDSEGVAQLPDLQFPSGGATLADSPYASLAALAEWLKANPAKTVALVGHTDASGGLAANIAVSRARAQSVRERLLARHGISEAQVEAEGVGYLAPRAGNTTPDGRQANRRVEVVITSVP